jgi:hypothetical protein
MDICSSGQLIKVKKVVIWGYPKDTHTHSYIHEAFYKAFSYLGYDTYWFNNKTDVSNFDFSNTLFLTSGDDECLKIPIRKDGLYILHNCPKDIFCTVLDRVVNIQVLTDPVYALEGTQKINEYTIVAGTAIYQPWATDLLPCEIDLGWANIERKNTVNYVGSVLDGGYNDVRSQLIGFSEGCRKDGIEVHAYGGYTPGADIGYLKRHSNFVTNERHIELIKESIYAPQLCSSSQNKMGYIPCRIFKNISYGHVGLTNSKAVNRVFNEALIYDEDTYALYYKAKEKVSPKKAVELMKIVKDKHTYINRINNILELFK